MSNVSEAESDEEQPVQANADDCVEQVTYAQDAVGHMEAEEESGLVGVEMDTLSAVKADEMHDEANLDSKELEESVLDCSVVGTCTEHRQRMATSNRKPWRCGNLALPVHYVAAGILLNLAQGLLYGVLLGTMAVPGRVYVTARIFVLAPWCLKCVFGWISDCFPINGFHRKFYSAYGWALSMLAHVLLAFLFKEPSIPKYCKDSNLGGLGNYVPAAGVCNPQAEEGAHTLVVLIALSVLGTTVAESAADGLTMECAQSWQQSDARGRIIMQSMALRLLGGSMGSCFLAFCFNSRKHLGWFDWELSFELINIGMACLGGCMTLLWIFLAQEDLPEIAPRNCVDCGVRFCGLCACCGLCQPPQSIMVPTNTFHNASTHCQDAWNLHKRLSKTLCSSLFARFLLFQLLSSVLCWMCSPADDMMKRYWAQVQQMQEQLGDVTVSLIFTVFITLAERILLRIDWRSLTALGAVFGCAGYATIGTVTALGILRDQYFYLVIDLVQQTPRALNFLVGTWIVSEISPERLEATIFGVVASVHSLAPVLGRSVANPFYAQLPPMASEMPEGALSEAAYYNEDSKAFQMSVAVSVWCGAALMALPAMMVQLLPKDSDTARAAQLIKLNQYTKCCGTFWLPETCNSIRWYCGVGLCITLFVLATAGTLIAILPGTSCAQVVGGC